MVASRIARGPAASHCCKPVKKFNKAPLLDANNGCIYLVSGIYVGVLVSLFGNDYFTRVHSHLDYSNIF